MPSKIVLTLLLVAPLAVLAASPLGIELCRQAFAGGVRTILGMPVALAPPAYFLVGNGVYQVDFWCTPAALWLGAALLLFATRPGAGAYLRGLLLVLPLAAVAMVANVVLSIALNQRGVAWPWAHYPGLGLIYATTGVCCAARRAAFRPARC